MLRHWHKDDKPAAKALTEFGRETLNIMERFLVFFQPETNSPKTSRNTSV
jgi:hypothetical protein